MNEYDLTIIPKFGTKHKAIKQAAVSRDWEKVIELLDSQASVKRAGVFATVAELIFSEGYLIPHYSPSV